MATISDLEELLLNIPGVSEHTASLIIGELRSAFRGQRINIPEERQSKKEQILRAAAQLPTGVVAERYGVTSSYVCRVVKRNRKN